MALPLGVVGRLGRPKRPTAPNGRAISASVLPLTILALLACTNADAQTTAPAEQDVFAPLAKKAVPERVAAALTFTGEEARALSAIRDGSTQELAADASLPMLIARVATIGPLAPDEYRRLDTIRTTTLREHPDSFRFYPIRANLIVYRVRPVASGSGLRPTRRTDGQTSELHVPATMPVWELFAVDRVDRKPDPASPVLIYTTTDPMPALGSPDKEDSGWSSYFNGRVLEGAAIFYRVKTGTGTDGTVQDYPVLIMWQHAAVKDSSTWMILVVGLVIVLFFFLWLWARKGVRRRGPVHFSAPNPPLPDQAGETDHVDPELRKAVEGFQRDRGQMPTTPAADGPVDPELRKAVEQWKQERPDDDNRSR